MVVISTLKRGGRRRILISSLIYQNMDSKVGYSGNCLYFLHLKILKLNFSKFYILKKSLLYLFLRYGKFHQFLLAVYNVENATVI